MHRIYSTSFSFFSLEHTYLRIEVIIDFSYSYAFITRGRWIKWLLSWHYAMQYFLKIKRSTFLPNRSPFKSMLRRSIRWGWFLVHLSSIINSFLLSSYFHIYLSWIYCNKQLSLSVWELEIVIVLFNQVCVFWFVLLLFLFRIDYLIIQPSLTVVCCVIKE